MSSLLQYFRQNARKHWLAIIIFGVLGVGLTATLLAQINSLVPGYSSGEVAAYHAADSATTIWRNPINAPYELLVLCLRSVTPHHFLAVRLSSVFIGWLTLVVFGTIMFRWHGLRTAVIGTAFFGMSAWFLHVARLGSPQVMFLGLTWLVACGIWLRQKQSGLAALWGLILCALLLYTPGIAWFLGGGLLLQWPTIDRAFKKNVGAVSLGSALFLTLLTPLLWHFYKHPHEVTTWLCLPDTWNHPLQLIRSIVDVPVAIFFRAPQNNPLIWVGRMPILSAFGTTMFIAGAFVYGKYIRLARVRLLVLFGILGTIVIGLSQSRIPLTPLVPGIFAVITVGLGYILDVWYRVFPRNPIAQSLGLALFGCVLAMACIYSLRVYFVAWPQASVTRALFIAKEP